METPDITYDGEFIEEKHTKIIMNKLKEINYVHTEHLFYGEYKRSRVGYMWVSDTGLEYTFSKSMKHALPAHSFEDYPVLNCIREYVQGMTKQSFNSVLVNRYENGETSLSYHHDDDPWLGDEFIVVSLSFGDKRKFLVKQKEQYVKEGKKPILKEYILENGSMVIMGKSVQKYWVHSIPVQKRSLDNRNAPTGLRFNLTFRNVIPELFHKMPKPRIPK